MQPGVRQYIEQVCKEHQNAFLVKDHEHCGTFDSYHRIFNQANAEFICQLDADDYLHQDAVATCIEQLRRNPDAPYAYTDCVEVDKSGRFTGLGQRQQRTLANNSDLTQFIPFHLRFIRLEKYQQVGGYNPACKYCGDYDLALRLEEVGNGIYIKKPLYFYRVHGQNTSIKRDKETFQESQWVIEAAFARRRLSGFFDLWINQESRIVELRQLDSGKSSPKSHNSKPAGHSTSLCVTGMHRSGTSLLAQMLSQIGFDLGERCLPADQNNHRGYYEDMDFISVNQSLFNRQNLYGNRGWPDWGWMDSRTARSIVAEDLSERAKSLATTRRKSSSLWAFKDPRSTLVLDFWKRSIPDLRFIFIYRHPFFVERSIERLNAHIFAENPDLARLIWNEYNRSILAFHKENPDVSAVISQEDLISNPEPVLYQALNKLGFSGYDECSLAPSVDKNLLCHQPAEISLTTHIYLSCYLDTKHILKELDAAKASMDEIRDEITSPCLKRNDIFEGYRNRLGSRIGIVIVSFNRGPTLLDAVMSILDNSTRYHKIVIVDNGSTDSETHRVLNYLEVNGITVLRAEAGSLASARNLGISYLDVDYILPLDDDNRLLAGYLVLAEDILLSAESHIVYSDKRLFGACYEEVSPPDFSLEELCSYNYIDACAVYPKFLWDMSGGYDENVDWVCDWDLWLYAALNGFSFSRIPFSCFEYRITYGSYISAYTSSLENQIWTIRYLSGKYGLPIGTLTY